MADQKRFIDNGDGTVTDTETNLMWKQTDAYQDTSKWCNWFGAGAYVKDLNISKFAGFENWRLPTLEEAEELCDRIAIIHQGQVVACDTTVALIQRLDRKELTIILGQDLDTVPPPLAAFDAEIRPFRRLVVRYRPSQTPVADILAAVQAADLTILDLDRSFTVRPETFRSKGRNTPFAEWNLIGCPVATLLGGRVVWEAENEDASR